MIMTTAIGPCNMAAVSVMIGLTDIQAALGRIRDSIRVSPCTPSEAFSELTNNSIFLKLDNQQRTGAFKERGALNKLLTLSSQERDRGVIAASAGNHAQGVAYHAGRHRIRARILMPLPTPLTKVSATRAYGADVVLHGANYDEAYEKAVEQSQQERLTLIHAFDDDAVIAGQGTLGSRYSSSIRTSKQSSRPSAAEDLSVELPAPSRKPIRACRSSGSNPPRFLR